MAGCPEAAVTNIYTAVQAAVKHGALGLTVAHWAGVGHITHQTMAWPGLLTAAGLGWNSNIDWVSAFIFCFYLNLTVELIMYHLTPFRLKHSFLFLVSLKTKLSTGYI